MKPHAAAKRMRLPRRTLNRWILGGIVPAQRDGTSWDIDAAWVGIYAEELAAVVGPVNVATGGRLSESARLVALARVAIRVEGQTINPTPESD